VGQKEILEARQTELQGNIKNLLDTADSDNRSITDEEKQQIDGWHGEIRTATESLKTIAAVEATDAELRARQTVPVVQVTPIVPPVVPVYAEERSEPYRKGGTESWFMDRYNAEKGSSEARQRMDVATRYRADIEKRAGATTVAGAGGELAPPAWYENELINLLRPGRVFADRLNKKTLPGGVSSINLPKITTGTAVATQSTQNTAINNQDIVTTSVNTGITTIAGGTTVALQLLQQSPISVDDVILADLAKVLARQIDIAAITAVAAVSGINAVTYTSGTPTSIAVTQYVQQAIDLVSNGVYQAPDTIVMRPERWGKILAYGDASRSARRAAVRSVRAREQRAGASRTGRTRRATRGPSAGSTCTSTRTSR
jgi:HK97 family phage major capsid protein